MYQSKNGIRQNRLKKFMQVGIDVKCMHTSFGGQGLSGFGDIATLSNLVKFTTTIDMTTVAITPHTCSFS